MKDIMLGKNTYSLVESFSASLVDIHDTLKIDLENRKIFLRSLGKDKFLKLKEH